MMQGFLYGPPPPPPNSKRCSARPWKRPR